MKKRERSHPTAADCAPPSSLCAFVEITEAATRSAICPDDSGRFSSGIFPGEPAADRGTARASVSPAPELAPELDGRPENKNVATVIAGSAGKGRSIQDGRRSTEKNLIGMTLAWSSKLGFSISCLLALSVTTALRLPLLLAAYRLTVAPPRFPLLPSARLLSTRCTAIAGERMPGPEDTFAALQQTNSTAGTTDSTLISPSLERTGILIFGRS